MNDTALAHRLVRRYLRQLDEALAPLPPLRKAELRSQIAAHLAEELAPSATDAEVAEAIRRLGSPAVVAADAGVRPRPAPAPTDSLRWLNNAIRRRTWKFWVVLAVLVTAVTVFGTVLDGLETASTLSTAGQSGWWYPQDARHQVDTEAGNVQQTTVPERWRQRQGFFVQVYNNSRYTQTILGYAPDADESPGNARSAQLAVSTGPDSHGDPGSPTAQRYLLPVSIPPGQSRYLRVSWISTVCNMTGAQSEFDNILLRVRVGWITRTEDVSLGRTWAIQGTRQSTCPD